MLEMKNTVTEMQNGFHGLAIQLKKESVYLTKCQWKLSNRKTEEKTEK